MNAMVILQRQTLLFEMVLTSYFTRRLARRLNGWQQQRYEYPDDRDDNQQFYEREAPLTGYFRLHDVATFGMGKSVSRRPIYFLPNNPNSGLAWKTPDIGALVSLTKCRPKSTCRNGTRIWPLLSV